LPRIRSSHGSAPRSSFSSYIGLPFAAVVSQRLKAAVTTDWTYFAPIEYTPDGVDAIQNMMLAHNLYLDPKQAQRVDP
jgi:hypothetical protein